jgi:hypothetical protein
MPVARERIPHTREVLEQHGQRPQGRGDWLTFGCELHGGSDSLRVNTKTNGWCCMACGAKGGDAIAYVMQLDGIGFVDAAKQLGCWDEAAHGPAPSNPRPAGLSAPDALYLLREEARLIGTAWAMQRAGHVLTDAESERALQAVGRINLISGGLDAAH